ncbi:DUF5949 family protein [Streptomyces graminofaciens]|uniref:DUF5949 family protein n=1 Tax=Streptomyces graminofaciens TaxID=68212 RepID=UPI0025747C16|nr:DUF5949 family protein [Streptomyces graminofaciens]
MTSIPTETRSFRPGELGTLVVLARSGEALDGDMPHPPGHTPGDGGNGPEASPAATETPTGAARVLLPARSPRA